jgi:(R,R)-butanediol dehydrogenase/meso-butanediol dehydrogenase/diacetyl reductase
MVVKIDYVGICGTDLEFYRLGTTPPFTRLPLTLGHENCGTVVEVGEGVTKFKVGDKILCGPPSHCAEDCPPCQEGRTNICLHGFPRTAGLGQYDGGYAEYMLINDVAHTMLVPIPEGVDEKAAVLFDIICVAIHAVRRSDFRFGDNVVVSGTGPVGLSAIQILKASGANNIIALDVLDSKKDIALEYGADYFINSKTCPDLAGEVKKILGGDIGAEIVFECSGSVQSLDTCINACVRPGGQVMVVGVIQEPMSNLIPGQIIINEPDVNFSFAYNEIDVKIYLDMVAKGKIVFPEMVTGVVSLDECVEKIFDGDRSGHRKVLIDPSL